MKRLYISCISLCLLLILTGCANNVRVNKLHPLSDITEKAGKCLFVSEDSIRDLAVGKGKNPYNIRIPIGIHPANLDTVFSSYDFIPLETNEKCIVGQITKILACKDCFCILDRDNKNVFIFDNDGRFRCKLGEKGHGPREHVDAWNIAYDEESETISLLDLSGRKLQHFDLDGNFLGEQSLYILFTEFEYLKERMVLFTGKSYNEFSDIFDLYQMVITDKKMSPISRGFKTTNEIRQEFRYSGVFKKNDNKVLYDDLLSDTIWSVNERDVSPFIVMDIENKRRFSQNEKLHMTDQLYKEGERMSANVIDWHVTPKYISLIYYGAEGCRALQNLVYSRRSGRSKIFGINNLPTRLGDDLARAAFDGISSDNRFYRIVQPMSIIEATSNDDIKRNLTSKEQEMVNKISIASNPVIMIENLIEF